MNKVCRTEDGTKEFVISDSIENYLTAFGITIQIKEKTEGLSGMPCYRCILIYNNQELKIRYDDDNKKFIANANNNHPLIEYYETYPGFKACKETIRIDGKAEVSIYHSRSSRYSGIDNNGVESVYLNLEVRETERRTCKLSIDKLRLGNARITFFCSEKCGMEVTLTTMFGNEYSPQDYLDMLKEQLNSTNPSEFSKTLIDLMLSDSRLLEYFKIIIDSMPKTLDAAYKSAIGFIRDQRDREVADVMRRYDGELIELYEEADEYKYRSELSGSKGFHR